MPRDRLCRGTSWCVWAPRRTFGDAGSIGDRPTWRSAGSVEAGFAGRGRAEAAQACQIVHPDGEIAESII
jgi:hypothetical protein